ncbi:MAG TPA: DUF1223 domain-containing protein [Gammaproteobacteria bacterium]|nr:DUF1223 domain-containing protein [Gammaproteobacteria bacterium]
MKIISFLLLFTICVMPLSAAAEQVFHSGNNRVSVLELYTSEGCSSCPPADRWLSGLKEDSRLWNELIPVAFHVDYWNYIGWSDRFAAARYSDRQRRYARSKNVSTVYTPGFILNGKEWRSYFGLRRLSLDDDAAGVLKIRIEGDHITGSYTPARSGSDSVTINIAILGFGLETQVKAGENRGKTLHHDFTVLGLVQRMMKREGDSFTVSGGLPDVSVAAPHMAVAAWVNGHGDQTPLQATGGWLTK